MKTQLGEHYLADFKGCDADRLRLVADVEPVFLEAARLAKATILQAVFRQFEPQGVTGIILIAESHFALHTWPEHSFIGLDIFTCGKEMSAQTAIDHIAQVFRSQEVSVQKIIRGI